MKSVGPFGVVPDTRTTGNSNVGMTELPPGFTPVNPPSLVPMGAPLAAIGVALVDGYRNQVHSQRLSVDWNKDPYWGKR